MRSKGLRRTLCKLGLKYVYYPGAKKYWLIIKEDFKEKTNNAFKDLRVEITFTGRRHQMLLLGKHHLKNNTSVKKCQAKRITDFT